MSDVLTRLYTRMHNILYSFNTTAKDKLFLERVTRNLLVDEDNELIMKKLTQKMKESERTINNQIHRIAEYSNIKEVLELDEKDIKPKKLFKAIVAKIKEDDELK